MAKRSVHGRQFNIQEAADEIVRVKQFAGGVPSPSVKRFHFRCKAIRDQIDLARTSSLLRYYWQSALIEPHEHRQIEFVDTIGELSRESANLRSTVEALEMELAGLKSRLESVEQELPLIRKARLATIDQLCRAYVEMVSPISEVVEVLLVEDENVVVIWTIIDAAPFEDQLRIPVYNAQLKTLRSSEVDRPIGFHLLNLSEIPDKTSLGQIIPPQTRSIWHR